MEGLTYKGAKNIFNHERREKHEKGGKDRGKEMLRGRLLRP
jgi:hypothetical protein